MSAPIIIVGAGQAGLQAAESLRAEGYKGELRMIGDESVPPYQRPPLSKGYIVGDVDDARLFLRSADVLANNGIELDLDRTVTAIDRGTQHVALSDGTSLAYSGLVLATGARARGLPVVGSELRGVVYLRTLRDARHIADALAGAHHVAVIGGGFIGLEMAATARKLGKDVTVFEALPRLMARVVAPPTSLFFAELHMAHGVHLLFDTQVTALVGSHGKVAGIVTHDGRTHRADLVIVGIGVIPNDDLARASGLMCDRGIIVDSCARTSDPAIVAAGDCTARRSQDDSRLIRLESVHNAIEQGKSAAAWLCGRERPFIATPWFWSDQYDVKLQMAGLSTGYDEVAVRGVLAERSVSTFYFREHRLIAVDSINRPADHVAARKLLEKGLSIAPVQAADPTFQLNAVLRGQA